ncbi:hypothetical protein H0H87_011971, partial [Tephrocybe sp. NHM501043]
APILFEDENTKTLTLINSARPKLTVTVHPFQLKAIIEFDAELRATNGYAHTEMPAGYMEVVNVINLADYDKECKYALSMWDYEKKKWSISSIPFPPKFYWPTTYIPISYQLLVMLGFISKEGVINTHVVKETVQGWHNPLGQKVQATKNYLSHRSKVLSALQSLLISRECCAAPALPISPADNLKRRFILDNMEDNSPDTISCPKRTRVAEPSNCIAKTINHAIDANNCNPEVTINQSPTAKICPGKKCNTGKGKNPVVLEDVPMDEDALLINYDDVDARDLINFKNLTSSG